jgi:thiamine biosynthesis protein ThiI
MIKTVVVRYGELALKSPRVRREFEQRLLENIRLSLGAPDHEILKERGRIFVNTNAPAKVAERLARVPGIVSVSPAIRTEATRDAVLASAVGAARKVLSGGECFAVRTRRLGKHPFRSQEINEEVGASILREVPGTSVNLTSPDREIFIEVRDKDAYIFTEVVEGVGGLPVGTQGAVVALFSGEANGLAAALLMLRRGCLVYPVFFDGGPRQRRERAVSSAKKLLRFHPRFDFRVVEFDEVQKVIEGAPDELSYLLSARAMLRAAEEVARGAGGEALVTGEEVGQDQRRALQSFQAANEVTGMAVFRPLAGLNQARIKWLLQRLGMGGAASRISPPNYPKFDVDLEDIQRLERELGIDSLIKDALEKVEVVKLG